MTRDDLIEICNRLDACDESIDWLRSLPCATAAECWDACERADWMAWLLTARHGIVPARTLRLVAVDCARAVQPIADTWFAAHAPQHVGAGVRLLDLIESDADPQTWAAARAAASAAAMDAAMYAASDAAMYAASAAAWAAAMYAASDAAMYAARAAASAAARAAASAAAWADQARMVRARVEWADVERGLRAVMR